MVTGKLSGVSLCVAYLTCAKACNASHCAYPQPASVQQALSDICRQATTGTHAHVCRDNFCVAGLRRRFVRQQALLELLASEGCTRDEVKSNANKYSVVCESYDFPDFSFQVRVYNSGSVLIGEPSCLSHCNDCVLCMQYEAYQSVGTSIHSLVLVVRIVYAMSAYVYLQVCRRDNA